jgi:hypothetical protein
MYSNADAAALYDVLNPLGPSDDFYLSFLMDAPSVLVVARAATGLRTVEEQDPRIGGLVPPDV